MEADSKPPACPVCGSPRVAVILYGLPHFTPELEKGLRDGRIVLGGCTIFGNDPRWQCRECSHTWGTIEWPRPEGDALA